MTSALTLGVVSGSGGGFDITTDTAYTVGSTGDFTTLSEAIIFLKTLSINPTSIITLNLLGESINEASTLTIAGIYFKLIIQGATPINGTITRVTGGSGSASAWTPLLNITGAQAAGIQVGHGALICATGGISSSRSHVAGCWKVTEVNTNSIRVGITTTTDTGSEGADASSEIVILPSRLSFTTGGLYIHRCESVELRNFVVESSTNGVDIGFYTTGSRIYVDNFGIAGKIGSLLVLGFLIRDLSAVVQLGRFAVSSVNLNEISSGGSLTHWDTEGCHLTLSVSKTNDLLVVSGPGSRFTWTRSNSNAKLCLSNSATGIAIKALNCATAIVYSNNTVTNYNAATLLSPANTTGNSGAYATTVTTNY